jgi:hypothetical protein
MVVAPPLNREPVILYNYKRRPPLRLMILILSILFFPGISQAEAPYVHPISPEAGSPEGIVVRIEGATVSDFFAPGYEEVRILGKKFRIKGLASNVSGLIYEDVVITFSARDIFDNVLAASRAELSPLEPGGEASFECTLDVPVAFEFNMITYSVIGRRDERGSTGH